MTTTNRVTLSMLAASLLAVALAPAATQAQEWGRWRAGDGMMLPALLRSANLTPDQTTKMHEILKTRRVTAQSIVQQLRQAQQDLADRLLAPGAVALGDLQPLLDRIAQLRGQLVQNSAQGTLEIRALLTADQLAKAADTKDKLRQLRNEMHQLLSPGQP